jgi:hypothetical protein
MNCQKHPRYKGIRKPRTGCTECWRFYVNQALPPAPFYEAPSRWKSVVLHVDMTKATWRELALWVAAYAFQPILMPVLLILSKIRHRPYEFGVSWHEVKVLDVEVIDETPEA